MDFGILQIVKFVCDSYGKQVRIIPALEFGQD